MSVLDQLLDEIAENLRATVHRQAEEIAELKLWREQNTHEALRAENDRIQEEAAALLREKRIAQDETAVANKEIERLHAKIAELQTQNEALQDRHVGTREALTRSTDRVRAYLEELSDWLATERGSS